MFAQICATILLVMFVVGLAMIPIGFIRLRLQERVDEIVEWNKQTLLLNIKLGNLYLNDQDEWTWKEGA